MMMVKGWGAMRHHMVRITLTKRGALAESSFWRWGISRFRGRGVWWWGWQLRLKQPPTIVRWGRAAVEGVGDLGRDLGLVALQVVTQCPRLLHSQHIMSVWHSRVISQRRQRPEVRRWWKMALALLQSERDLPLKELGSFFSFFLLQTKVQSSMLAQRPSTLVLMMINSCSYVY